MRTTTTTCDRCGRRIEADATTLSAPYGKHRDRLPEPIDLCPGCWSAFMAWLEIGGATIDGRTAEAVK